MQLDSGNRAEQDNEMLKPRDGRLVLESQPDLPVHNWAIVKSLRSVHDVKRRYVCFGPIWPNWTVWSGRHCHAVPVNVSRTWKSIG
jgi:hypothetical protein